MVLFTPEKLIFKGSKKQHQILAQTAYYQAGKIVVQTILPEQPPVALITLNTLGTTCSTSADTYIPIENIFNTQSCSSLESRLVSLYGGKAASLLIEYEQRLKFFNKNNNSSFNDSLLTHNKSFIYPTPLQGKGVRVSKRYGIRSQVNAIRSHNSFRIPPANARVNPYPTKDKDANDDQTSGWLRFAPLETPRIVVREKHIPFNFNNSGTSKEGLTKQRSPEGTILFQRGKKLTKQKIGKRSQAGTETKLINNVVRVRSQVFNFSELTLLPNSAARPHTPRVRGKEWKLNDKTRLVRTCFAGAGNNIFQSTLGNIEIQTATRLAKIMVNYWNFYSLNKISLYSLVKKNAPAYNSFGVPVYRKTSRNSMTRRESGNGITYPAKGFLRTRSWKFHVNDATSYAPMNSHPNRYQTETWSSFAYPLPVGYGVRGQQLKDQKQKDLSYILKEKSVAIEAEGDAKPKCNVRVWGIKLKVKDKTPQGNIIYKYRIAKLNSDYPRGVCESRNNLYFAIAQSKNSLKICENQNSSYNIQRLSIENIGNYSQLNNNNFQLINSLQFSHLQRDRFYPNWFRLYLPDMEATEFLKNIANYYFSLGLQTLTFPSTKSSYSLPSSEFCSERGFLRTRSWQIHFSGALGKLNVSKASPFLSFLNKNTEKEKYKLFVPNISSYTYCPPAILINSPSVKSINSRNKLTSHTPTKMKGLSSNAQLKGKGSVASEQDKWYFSQRNTIWDRSKTRDIKDPSFTKVEGVTLDPLNVPFSLLLESQIFPLNYNGFSIVEKELLYNTLVNSSFAKAFYLINQNRQLLDFFVDYLLRFQILRQHQILYLFSTLLLACNKTT